MVLKVCSCCLKSRPQSSYNQDNWASIKIRRCNECAASNLPIKNPNIRGTFPLPSTEGRSVFATPDVANNIVPDKDGKLHLVLGGGKDPRNACARCGKGPPENGKLNHCARCKKINYCSKQCQVDDWKRHKREECVKKSGKGTQNLGLLKQDEDKLSKGFDKMVDGLEKVCLEKPNLSSWDNLPRSGRVTDEDKEAKLDFTLRYYLQLSSFAAYHIKKFYPLKGALFVFSKVSFPDLTNVPRNMEITADSELDRMFGIAWGCLPVKGVHNRPQLSALDLAEKFMDCATTLTYVMENCCDQDSFPLVFCCDPSGEKLPDLFNEHCRFPKNVDPICYIDESPDMTSVGPVRFLDFDSMLEIAAGGYCDAEVKLINMDRDKNDPNYM